MGICAREGGERESAQGRAEKGNLRKGGRRKRICAREGGEGESAQGRMEKKNLHKGGPGWSERISLGILTHTTLVAFVCNLNVCVPHALTPHLAQIHRGGPGRSERICARWGVGA
jgi:hypothetical protein